MLTRSKEERITITMLIRMAAGIGTRVMANTIKEALIMEEATGRSQDTKFNRSSPSLTWGLPTVKISLKEFTG